jgi:hypothetical protein
MLVLKPFGAQQRHDEIDKQQQCNHHSQGEHANLLDAIATNHEQHQQAQGGKPDGQKTR